MEAGTAGGVEGLGVPPPQPPAHPECVVCFNPVDPGARAARMVTPCGHLFHAPCLTRWLEQSVSCPICRAPLPPP